MLHNGIKCSNWPICTALVFLKFVFFFIFFFGMCAKHCFGHLPRCFFLGKKMNDFPKKNVSFGWCITFWMKINSWNFNDDDIQMMMTWWWWFKWQPLLLGRALGEKTRQAPATSTKTDKSSARPEMGIKKVPKKNSRPTHRGALEHWGGC